MDATEILECGHPPTPTDGGGTGYARDPETGERHCYPCADERQRAALAASDTFGAYVSSDGKRITTWSGGTLARVTSCRTSGLRFPPNAGGAWTPHHWRAQTPDGAIWYGTNAAPGLLITIRRLKNQDNAQ